MVEVKMFSLSFGYLVNSVRTLALILAGTIMLPEGYWLVYCSI